MQADFKQFLFEAFTTTMYDILGRQKVMMITNIVKKMDAVNHINIIRANFKQVDPRMIKSKEMNLYGSNQHGVGFMPNIILAKHANTPHVDLCIIGVKQDDGQQEVTVYRDVDNFERVYRTLPTLRFDHYAADTYQTMFVCTGDALRYKIRNMQNMLKKGPAGVVDTELTTENINVPSKDLTRIQNTFLRNGIKLEKFDINRTKVDLRFRANDHRAPELPFKEDRLHSKGNMIAEIVDQEHAKIKDGKLVVNFTPTNLVKDLEQARGSVAQSTKALKDIINHYCASFEMCEKVFEPLINIEQ